MKYGSDFSEYLNEGRGSWDTLSGSLVSKVFKKWIKDWKSGKKESSYFEAIQDSSREIEFDLHASIYFGEVDNIRIKGFEVLETTGADGRDGVWNKDEDEWEDQDPFIIIDFAINDEWLPGEWSEVYMYLSDVMRHELEHITQDGVSIGNYRMGKPQEDDTQMRQFIKLGFLPQYHYLLLPKEVDANLQGLRYEAKKRKIKMIDVVNKYLDTQEYLTPETREEVLDTWRRRAKKIGGIPKF
jgi:hypothetical protein